MDKTKLVLTLLLMGTTLGLGLPQRRPVSKVYRQELKIREIQRQLKQTELKLDEAIIAKTELVLRYEWLCKCLGVDTKIVRDDKAWPKRRFIKPMRIGQKAFMFAPDILKVHYVIDKDTAMMTLWGAMVKKVWLKGVSTAGMEQGDSYSFSYPLKVTGSRIWGGDSFYVLEPTTLPEIKQEAIQ